MKRALLVLLPLVAACASDGSQKVQTYCERYAMKNMMYGLHENPAAYREDLMSSCMAMKKVPYSKGQASAAASAPAR